MNDYTPSNTATPPQGDPSEGPSIADLLSWDAEANGDPPVDALPLSDVRSYIEEERARAAAEAQERTLQAQREAEAQRRQREAETATAQQDIAYFNDLDSRLRSEDEAIRAAALAERNANAERFNRGGFLAAQHSQQQTNAQVLSQFFASMHTELKSAGLDGIIPPPGDPSWYGFQQKLGEYDGKGGFAAFLIDYGKQLAGTAEYERGKEEGARQTRAELGAGGAPNLSQGGGAPVVSQYGNRAWVEAQKRANPRWGQQPHPTEKDSYGRPLSNSAVALREMAKSR